MNGLQTHVIKDEGAQDVPVAPAETLLCLFPTLLQIFRQAVLQTPGSLFQGDYLSENLTKRQLEQSLVAIQYHRNVGVAIPSIVAGWI